MTDFFAGADEGVPAEKAGVAMTEFEIAADRAEHAEGIVVVKIDQCFGKMQVQYAVAFAVIAEIAFAVIDEIIPS